MFSAVPGAGRTGSKRREINRFGFGYPGPSCFATSFWMLVRSVELGTATAVGGGILTLCVEPRFNTPVANRVTTTPMTNPERAEATEGGCGAWTRVAMILTPKATLPARTGQGWLGRESSSPFLFWNVASRLDGRLDFELYLLSSKFRRRAVARGFH